MFYVVYCGVPILLLILFGLLRPRLAPLTLLICPVVDLLVYRREFFSYEGRGFMLLLTAAQLLIAAFPVLILILFVKDGKKENIHDT